MRSGSGRERIEFGARRDSLSVVKRKDAKRFSLPEPRIAPRGVRYRCCQPLISTYAK